MRALNPPGPRYVVPAGTAGLVCRVGSDEFRRHRTKTKLEFDWPYAFHGPELPVFQVHRDWLLSVPMSCITVNDYRTISALQFTLEGERNQSLIIWPDAYGRSPYARPKRYSDTMLDVRAYQEILWAGPRREQELVVTQVQLYRCNRHAENGQVIDCGRVWLAKGTTR